MNIYTGRAERRRAPRRRLRARKLRKVAREREKPAAASKATRAVWAATTAGTLRGAVEEKRKTKRILARTTMTATTTARILWRPRRDEIARNTVKRAKGNVPKRRPQTPPLRATQTAPAPAPAVATATKNRRPSRNGEKR